ncbi:MAG: ceramidase domain-containing protein [Methylohalobius sp. ZOD2]
MDIDRRYQVLFGVVLLAMVVAALVGPIPQDPAYHRFADSRACGWIPNCLNVLSNLAFWVVGGIGLQSVSHWPATLRPAWRVFWWGVFLTGFGSAWYHWAPDDARLVWDRLPMTLAFMGLFAAVLIDQFQLGRWVLLSLVLTGLASIGVWLAFDDLRLYGLVQFLPPALILLIFAFFPAGRISRRAIYLGLGFYAAAKGAEFLDGDIFALTGWLSGHSLKHLLAAVATVWLIRIRSDR